MAKTSKSGEGSIAKPFRTWTRIFLAELAATSNVAASARKAGISTGTVYETRRRNADFQRKWFDALCEGYDHLEMETLHRLRTGEIKPPAGAKKGVRVFDNASALRLMAAHRETVARLRAAREDDDENAVLASLDAKLGQMRERLLAAKARRDTGSDDEAQAQD